MMAKSVGMFLLAVLATKIAIAASDCLEPDTRVVGRWKNGNYYKGVVESLTNALNVLFDNGNRLSYNLHSKYDVLEDRIPEQNEIKWGDAVVVHRPHSFAFQQAHIREVVGGRYMVWYKDGSYIYQTKNNIRVFNKSNVCNEPAYLGCYRDQVPRYLTAFIPTRPATIAACVDMCNAQGYSIAALRNSDLCFCGNAYNKGYQTSDRRCDMPCYDNPYEECGGVDTFSQYWTGIVGDKPVYRPSGIQAYTKFHMDPYGFKQTYQSVIRKQSIPRFGKLPWRNILQARRAIKKPSSLAHPSPWRWNTLKSSWVRADGKQFRWTHLPPMGFKKTYRTWSSSQIPITKNGWTWNGRAWVAAAKTSTGLHTSLHPYPKATNPFSKSTYAKATLKPSYNKGFLQATVKPRIPGLHPYNRWAPKYTNILKSFSNVDISKDFTPNLVLQKLADRMRTVKWSQISNFDQAFKPSSSIPLTFRYLGCFADDYQRDLPFQYSMPASSLTVRSCVLKCRGHGFSVAGVQGSTQCFCGNTYSKYGRVREEECMMKCGTSNTDICGGILRNSIYFTGIGSAWPHTKGNPSKTKTSKNSSSHVQSKANDKQAKNVTSAIHAKFGKAATLSKTKYTKTVRQGSRPSFKERKNKKTQKSKNKARNKINNVPKELPKKDISGIDDFQVESIKVKVNFSELKQALQTLSPEIVRRVQKDLSRMHHKEHTNHPREKVKVELEETKQSNNEDYDEGDVERIRNEIHNKALDRLSDDNIKEILRIMKIPKTELKNDNRGINFEDAVKSIHAARKKGMQRNAINVVNGKDVAHEEIESYSRISLDIPLKPTKRGSKTLAATRKEAKANVKRLKNYQKGTLKDKTHKKNKKQKSKTSIKAKTMAKVDNEKIHSTKKDDKKDKENINDVKTNPNKNGHLKANINAKTVGINEAKKLDVQSHKPNSKTSSSKVNTVERNSKDSNEKNKGKQIYSSSTKTDLSPENLKENKISSYNKSVVADGIKKTKAKNAVQKVLKNQTQSDVPVMKGKEKVSHKMSPDSKQISKDVAAKTDDGVESVATGPNNHISSVTKSPSMQNSATLPLSKNAGISQAHVGNEKKEKAQSPAQGRKDSHEDKQKTINRLPVNDDEKVKKSQSQSKVDDNGVIYLGGAAKINDESQEQEDKKSQNNPSEQTTNLKLNVEKEGAENGVILLGSAAQQLQKSKKIDEILKEDQNVPDSKTEVKKVTPDKKVEKGNITPGVSEKKKKKMEDNKVKTKEDQDVPDYKEKEKKATPDKKVEKGNISADIPKNEEKKKKDNKIETLKMKTNDDPGNDKQVQTETNNTAKKKAKTNDKKEAKAKTKQKQRDSEKELHESKVENEKEDKMLSKDNEQKQTTEKKTNKANSNNVADLKPGKDEVALNDKTLVTQNSVQTRKQGRHEDSDSKPTKTQNEVSSTNGGSGGDASGSSSNTSQTSFEQESKLLSFQKQNSIYGKSSEADLQKGLKNGENPIGNINSTKRKAEDSNQFDYSGMSEADKATESKIITKLNNLLNSGSGDENFEDVVNELEKNKIDGISAKGITITMAQGSGSNSSEETNVKKPQYSDNSDLKYAKTTQLGDEIKRIGGKPIGEDQAGNSEAAMSASHDQKSKHLKTIGLDSDANTGSGLDDASSGELSTKYTYFGSGTNKEELPLIRADDLKQLTKAKRIDKFENSGEDPERNSSIQGESVGKQSKTLLHPKASKQRLFVKSSIPTPPRYKMILIPKLPLATKKKIRKEKLVAKSRKEKLVLGKKTSSRVNAKPEKITRKKMIDQINKKKNQRKNVQKGSTIQTEQSSKRKNLKKALSKGKYYSDVKGIRVVKNGVAFTVSKGQSTANQNSRPLKASMPSTNGSSRNLGETITSSNRFKNNKLKIHHISERRRKSTEKRTMNVRSSKINASEEVDDAHHNLKDHGSRNQLIWRGTRSNELNRNLED